MAKHWYYIFILLIAFSALSTPLLASNTSQIEQIAEFNDINIYFAQNNLRVTGGEGLKLQIFNVTGILVVTENIDSTDKRFSLDLPRGCYIVKVGKLVKKISVK
ncbi:T9SS type A sorting domain-containing protein [Prevotella herbatica]|uniref:T9SS type A sorting domain-containing protein n=1 Tax=Prevotella herbatica TaxID=2801997 RepID=A0ABN6EG03_9BACT|nr:T9SS type A sorting domain-containing protein [Prevotella herbatica]BCS84200.1 T9SS type A sorting domain-containing protein [Prevotella herbatica]